MCGKDPETSAVCGCKSTLLSIWRIVGVNAFPGDDMGRGPRDCIGAPTITRTHPLNAHASTDPMLPDSDLCGIAMSRSMGDIQLHMVGVVLHLIVCKHRAGLSNNQAVKCT